VGENYRDIGKLWGKLPGYRKNVGGNYRDIGKLWEKITGI